VALIKNDHAKGPITIGSVVIEKRSFSQEDFDRFAALSGDDNPIHVDPSFAARSKFKRTVAHGMMLYSAVCGVLGTKLPGPGTVQIGQSLMFPTPTFTGEEVSFRVEVLDISIKQGVADLSTTVIRPDGNNGLQGQTRVYLPGTPLWTKPVSQGLEGSAGMPSEVSFKGLELGQQAKMQRTFTEEDLHEYVDLIGDTNPIYIDAKYARQLNLEGPIIPGGLLACLFSSLLGTELPGCGTNYLKQGIEFPNPTYPGEELTATVEIMRIRPEKQLVNLRTVCTAQQDKVVCQGEALVLVSDVEGLRNR
jgi:acyl dehydratase